VRAAAERLRG